MKVGIVGLGFVGGAMLKSFTENKVNVIGYDKYKNGGINNLSDVLLCDIIFLCLPTLYNRTLKEYNKTAITETLTNIQHYNGLVVLKSTLEPETTQKYATEHKLNLVHNPEFLSAVTCYEDFHNQKHIVLGKTKDCDKFDLLVEFYQQYYPNASISICTSTESESMKIFANCFYSAKIQFFNELYLLCQSNGTDYEVVKNLMLKNGWINPMHTKVPCDSQLSFSGFCFPKDCNALLQYMIKQNSNHKVLNAVIEERNEMRKDDVNLED